MFQGGTTRSCSSLYAGLHKCCCTQVKTATQQWKQFPGSEGGSLTLTSYYPQSNDGLSQGLQAFSYQSNSSGITISNGDASAFTTQMISQFVMVNLWENIQGMIVPIFDGSHWTLNF